MGCEKNVVVSTSMLEVSVLRGGTVLRLESDAWSMVKRLRQATNEYTSPPPLHPTPALHERAYNSPSGGCKLDGFGVLAGVVPRWTVHVHPLHLSHETCQQRTRTLAGAKSTRALTCCASAPTSGKPSTTREVTAS